ncbi:MAG: hypothetical protein M1827_006608 [Pycnora praestabilis]|nr:MAG: hypothetical protein M1827_006608 [Pycnora praestabilis]
MTSAVVSADDLADLNNSTTTSSAAGVSFSSSSSGSPPAITLSSSSSETSSISTISQSPASTPVSDPDLPHPETPGFQSTVATSAFYVTPTLPFEPQTSAVVTQSLESVVSNSPQSTTSIPTPPSNPATSPPPNPVQPATTSSPAAPPPQTTSSAGPAPQPQTTTAQALSAIESMLTASTTITEANSQISTVNAFSLFASSVSAAGGSIVTPSPANPIVVQPPTTIIPVAAASPPAVTIGNSIYTANAATQFSIAPSVTLTPGGAVTYSGTTISLAPAASFIAVGSNTQIISYPATTAPPALVLGGNTYTANSATQYVVAPGNTLVPGGIATLSGGTLVSLAPSASFLVVGGNTQVLASQSRVAAALTVGSQVFTTNSAGNLVVGSSTLSINGPAATISGNQVISLGSQGVVVAGQSATSTYALTTPTLGAVVSIGNAAVTIANPSSGVYVEGSVTLSVGGPAVTVSGEILSAAPSGVVVQQSGGQITTIPLSAIPKSQATASAALITIGSSVFTAVETGNPSGSNAVYVFGSSTLSVGGTALTVSGETISAAPSGLVIVSNGHTITVPVSTAALASPLPTSGVATVEEAALTINGKTYTALENFNSAGFVVIGSSTLSIGGPAVTIGGETISLGSSGLVEVSGSVTSTVPFTSAVVTFSANATRSSSFTTTTAGATTGNSVSGSAKPTTTHKGMATRTGIDGITTLLVISLCIYLYL